MSNFNYITSGEYLKAPNYLRHLLANYFMVDNRPAASKMYEYLNQHFPFLTEREKYDTHTWYNGYSASIKRCINHPDHPNLKGHWDHFSAHMNPVIIALNKHQDDYTHHQIEVARANLAAK